MKTQFKSINFEIKADEDNDRFMRFKGIASPFDGKADLGGDIIEEGAFKRSIDQKGDQRVLLWHHKTEEPIGTVRLEETKEGLMITEGLINKNIQRGREVAEMIAMGAVKGLSIGYRAVKSGFKDGSRLLKEIALFEMSLVPFAMNEGAMVTEAKAEENDIKFEEALKIVLSKIGEAKESDFDLMNKTVKEFNALLVKSISNDSENSEENDLSEKLSTELSTDEIKAELNNFFKGFKNGN